MEQSDYFRWSIVKSQPIPTTKNNTCRKKGSFGHVSWSKWLDVSVNVCCEVSYSSYYLNVSAWLLIYWCFMLSQSIHCVLRVAIVKS